MATLLLTACCGAASQAEPHCALDTVELMARGELAAVAARFRGGETPALRHELQAMLQAVGRFTELAPQSAPAFSASGRLSARASGVSNPHSFRAAWVGARSPLQGRVQWQVALEPDSRCVLLALHLHWPLADSPARPTAE